MYDLPEVFRRGPHAGSVEKNNSVWLPPDGEAPQHRVPHKPRSLVRADAASKTIQRMQSTE